MTEQEYHTKFLQEFELEFPDYKDHEQILLHFWSTRVSTDISILILNDVHLNIEQIIDFIWFLVRFANRHLRSKGTAVYLKNDAVLFSDDDGLHISFEALPIK